MSRSERSALLFTTLLSLAVCAAAQSLSPAQRQAALAGIGRTATPAEVKAWDIDVRPDFKGLPKGKGSVAQGEVIWEARCASCHGSFGESSEIFTPIAGGTTVEDMKTGHVDGLMPGANQPQRTTLMKASTLSTLWDYINRAMPWNAPKSLSPDDVYAVTAYILNLGNILPAGFTLSDTNIRDVQANLPNRKGMTTGHAMWPGRELGGTAKPDVQGSACMNDCAKEVVIKSFLPDYARDSHGNLAGQFRMIGPYRGADTTKPAPATFIPLSERKASVAPVSIEPSATESIATPAGGPVAATAAGVMPLLQKNACLACHGIDNKLVGPSFRDVADKYKDRADVVNYLSGKIRSGGQGVWGNIPMPAQALSEAEAAQVARWLSRGMPG